MGNLATHQDTVPHVFVLSDASSDHLEMLRTLTVRDARPCHAQRLDLVLQTFLELRDRGLPVQLMPTATGRINFMHVRQLRSRKPNPASLLSRFRRIMAPFLGRASTLCRTSCKPIKSSGSLSSPHRPQPGLIPPRPRRNVSNAWLTPVMTAGWPARVIYGRAR